MQAEIYLLRHGETTWNTEGRLQGQQDAPLTLRGREQAQLLGEILAQQLGARHPLRMYVSPLGRTRETAAIVRQYAESSDVIYEPRIQEVALGAWEGLTREEIEARWPGSTDGCGEGEWYFRAPGGESYANCEQRIQGWLLEQTRPAIVVSHEVAGQLIRGLYLGLTSREALVLPAPQDVVWRLADGKIEALSL
jgi:probable phosphoglycerate mutase